MLQCFGSCIDLFSGCRVKVSLRDLISDQFSDQVRLSLFLHMNHTFVYLKISISAVCLFTPIYACVLLQWYTLNDVKSGRLHLVLEWVPKVSEPTRHEQAMCFYYIYTLNVHPNSIRSTDFVIFAFRSYITTIVSLTWIKWFLLLRCFLCMLREHMVYLWVSFYFHSNIWISSQLNLSA